MPNNSESAQQVLHGQLHLQDTPAFLHQEWSSDRLDRSCNLEPFFQHLHTVLHTVQGHLHMEHRCFRMQIP